MKLGREWPSAPAIMRPRTATAPTPWLASAALTTAPRIELREEQQNRAQCERAANQWAPAVEVGIDQNCSDRTCNDYPEPTISEGKANRACVHEPLGG